MTIPHIIRGKLTGVYETVLACNGYGFQHESKKLIACLSIGEDNSYSLYFIVMDGGRELKTQNLSYAIRAYETGDLNV